MSIESHNLRWLDLHDVGHLCGRGEFAKNAPRSSEWLCPSLFGKIPWFSDLLPFVALASGDSLVPIVVRRLTLGELRWEANASGLLFSNPSGAVAQEHVVIEGCEVINRLKVGLQPNHFLAIRGNECVALDVIAVHVVGGIAGTEASAIEFTGRIFLKP